MLQSDKNNLKQINTKMEKNAGKILINHRENKRQKERGVDQTYRSMASVPYKALKKDTHTLFLMAELRMRCLEHGDGENFKWADSPKMLKRYLKPLL